MAHVVVSSVLDAPFETVAAHLQTPRLLQYVVAPILTFVPVDPPEMPEAWGEGRFTFAMRLFGVLPIGRQTIVARRELESRDELRFLDDGSGSIAKVWEHRLQLHRRGDGRTDYADKIRIEAGLMTPLVKVFAALLFRHRHRRWKQLVASEFRY